jgi:molybdate transport system regulatory protein
MAKKNRDTRTPGQTEEALAKLAGSSHARIVVAPDSSRGLDTVQLNRLEESFRQWLQAAQRTDVRLSRQRILFIFLLIRYTGAKLNEVLALDPFEDLDPGRHLVVFGKAGAASPRPRREVQMPAGLSREIKAALEDAAFRESLGSLFKVDPGHVRRKFYERALACGFPKELGGPDTIRKSRAVELMQSNVPLPVVQNILGHSTPNLTAALVSFSEEDMRQVTRFFLDKESRRKTSARNTFFGKISDIRVGDIQAQVELVTLGGYAVATVITNDSLARLGLKVGTLIIAEVKAPWVVLHKGAAEPLCSAENRFCGAIDRIRRGAVTTEYVVRIADGTELCSLVTTASSRRLDLRENDQVWAVFNSFAVVLHLD